MKLRLSKKGWSVPLGIDRQFHRTRFADDYQTQVYETVLAVVRRKKNLNTVRANQAREPHAGKEAA
jgi:hypothetical protein